MINYNSKIDLSKKILLFIIYPFGGFLYSLKDLNSKNSYIVFYLFMLLFGYTFIADNKDFDSYRYIQDFIYESNHTHTQYINKLKEYFTFESTIKDIYVTSCNYFISRITTNYHFLMALFAAIFGYFYLKSFNYITSNPNFNRSIIFYILAFIFTFSNPIFNINGVRFWTASWIAIYAIFKIFIDKERIYIFLAFLTPLIHISYIIYILIILAAYFTNKYQKTWIILFFCSFIFSYLALDLISQYKDLFPYSIQNLIWSYTESEGAINRMNNAGQYSLPLYARILNSLPRLHTNIIIVIFIIIFNKKSCNPTSKNLFNLLLVWSTFVNFTASIPSMLRFSSLTTPIIVYIWINNYHYLKKYNYIIYIIPIVYSYQILYWISYMASISDPYLYLSNSIHIFLKNLL